MGDDEFIEDESEDIDELDELGEFEVPEVGEDDELELASEIEPDADY